MSGAGDRSETDKAYSQLIEWGVEIPSKAETGQENKRTRSNINRKVEEIKAQYCELKNILQKYTGNQAFYKRVEMVEAAFLRKMSDLELLRVYVCGDAKRGKSAFINALLGKKELTVEHYRYRTGVLVYINKAEEGSLPEYSVVYKGSEEIKTVSEDEAKMLITAEEPKIARAHIICDSPLLRHLNIELVDTPGSDSFYPDVIEDAVKTDLRWDAVLYVVDSGESPLTGKDIEQIKEWERKQIPVGVIQTAKELVSAEGGQEIRKSNEEHLLKDGAYPSLGYYCVDSALRFESEKDRSVKDLTYSGFPQLLFDAHRSWIPCILNHRLSSLDKILLNLQKNKEVVERLSKELHSEAGTFDRERAALKAELEKKKNDFLAKIKDRFAQSEYEKKMKALDNVNEQSKMDQIKSEFDLAEQTKCFSSEVNQTVNEYFSPIKEREKTKESATSNKIVTITANSREVTGVFYQAAAWLFSDEKFLEQLLAQAHLWAATVALFGNAAYWMKNRKERRSLDGYRTEVKKACLELWLDGSPGGKEWARFEQRLNDVVKTYIDDKLSLRSIAISAKLSLMADWLNLHV